jgi:branched-chain amino acid transport system permease protein
VRSSSGRRLNVAAKIMVFILLVELRPAARLHRHLSLRAHDVLRHRRLRRRIAAPMGRAGRARRHLDRAACCRCCSSLVVGPVPLRVRAIFFAMITLAVASAFQTLASQLSDLTKGEDGLSFRTPRR